MIFSTLRKQSHLRVGFSLLSLSLFCGCDAPIEDALQNEDSPYEVYDYPYDKESRIKAPELPMPFIDATHGLSPFRIDRDDYEIHFPMHWMHFDRPVMLYIDDPPGLDDSLMMY